MLPLLALIGGGVSLVDGLDSVSTLDRLGLTVDTALSDVTLMEPHLSLLNEDDSSALIDSKALDDFRIEHDSAVGRLLPQSSDLVPASDMADHAMVQDESMGHQAFPCWPGAPSITYNDFATWLGYDQSPLKAVIQPFPFDVGYLTPGDIASRPAYAGIIGDRLTLWLDDRITGVYRSAFDLEPAGTAQSSNLPAAELSAEEQSHGLSALAELIRGGMIIAGLEESFDSGAVRRSAHYGKAATAGRAGGRCNHLSYTRSNGESDWHDQWRIRRENRRYFNTDAGLFFADGQPGSQPADHCPPRE